MRKGIVFPFMHGILRILPLSLGNPILVASERAEGQLDEAVQVKRANHAEMNGRVLTREACCEKKASCIFSYLYSMRSCLTTREVAFDRKQTFR